MLLTRRQRYGSIGPRILALAFDAVFVCQVSPDSEDQRERVESGR